MKRKELEKIRSALIELGNVVNAGRVAVPLETDTILPNEFAGFMTTMFAGGAFKINEKTFRLVEPFLKAESKAEYKVNDALELKTDSMLAVQTVHLGDDFYFDIPDTQMPLYWLQTTEIWWFVSANYKRIKWDDLYKEVE